MNNPATGKIASAHLNWDWLRGTFPVNVDKERHEWELMKQGKLCREIIEEMSKWNRFGKDDSEFLYGDWKYEVNEYESGYGDEDDEVYYERGDGWYFVRLPDENSFAMTYFLGKNGYVHSSNNVRYGRYEALNGYIVANPSDPTQPDNEHKYPYFIPPLIALKDYWKQELSEKEIA